MAKPDLGRGKFDNSWPAWKDRLGIAAVVLSLLLILFFMFTDASLNFQCSVTDFLFMKCNRFDREFKKWSGPGRLPSHDRLIIHRTVSWHTRQALPARESA